MLTAQQIAEVQVMLRALPRDERGGVAAGRPRNGQLVKALRNYLINRQNGHCVYCGATGTLSDVAHFVPARGKPVVGYLPGNVGATHRKCNEAMGDTDFSDILHRMPGAAYIVTDWTDFRVSVVEDIQDSEEDIARERANRAVWG